MRKGKRKMSVKDRKRGRICIQKLQARVKSRKIQKKSKELFSSTVSPFRRWI